MHPEIMYALTVERARDRHREAARERRVRRLPRARRLSLRTPRPRAAWAS
ncbi:MULTISPECIES: hypothetical protein [Actinoallomurus]|nr:MULTISPECIES: hypothetical protein [Actinoallomurus]MCO5968567.1 hypothetical protein [Actinoallomurus soli]MCO5993069.1 hypothetical protein [Actinoallomurus rhizosphaericola]